MDIRDFNVNRLFHVVRCLCLDGKLILNTVTQFKAMLSLPQIHFSLYL